VSSLLDKRLLLVTGKGGSGKTTLAVALGLAAARLGKRVVLCEVAGQDRAAQLVPELTTVSVDPDEAQLKSRTLAGVLGGSRLFQYLTAAAPGISELVTIGKVWDLAQIERRTGSTVFDLAIVDAPATGHALAMLRSPSTFAAVAPVGPVGRHAATIDRSLRDPKHTGVLTAALPEEMPVNETASLEHTLTEDVGVSVDRVYMNALYPERFSKDEAERLEAVSSNGNGTLRAACRAALSETRRAAAQREQLARLAELVTAPVRTLPFVFEPELGVGEIHELSEAID
jgi:anion-transporting  ArsA/GET3 family ATPase